MVTVLGVLLGLAILMTIMAPNAGVGLVGVGLVLILAALLGAAYDSNSNNNKERDR